MPTNHLKPNTNTKKNLMKFMKKNNKSLKNNNESINSDSTLQPELTITKTDEKEIQTIDEKRFADLNDDAMSECSFISDANSYTTLDECSNVESSLNGSPFSSESALNEKESFKHFKHHGSKDRRSLFAFRRVYFIMGIFIGACTIYLATLKMDDVKDVTNTLKTVLSDIGMSEYLTSDFVTNMSKTLGENFVEDDDFLPGRDLAEKYNLTAKYPIFIIPGITSCGLETWMVPKAQSSKCSETYFRKRMWGTLNMPKAILLDRTCWLEHMMLDPVTGLDPPGYKLRASAGLSAADYLFPGYWVWNKVITNLGTLGYDSNNLVFSSYDWRLSMSNNENRDGYFTDLKMSIERNVKLHKQKVVIITHSMGFNMFFYFLNWVESPEGGNGGKGWVDKYIKTQINVAGTALGVSKSVSALLSGETKDTAQLGTFLSYILEKFLSMKERITIFRNYGSISSMLPKGGDKIWGFPKSKAPDQSKESYEKYGSFGSLLNIKKQNAKSPKLNNTTSEIFSDDMIPFLRRISGTNYQNMLKSEYSHEIAYTKEQIEKNKKDKTKWINPLEVSLPEAPNMNIYCLYGINKPTERRYFYLQDLSKATQKTASSGEGFESHPDLDENLGFSIDPNVNNPEANIQGGIQFSDGDGTVPLVSLGYMCEGGWRKERYNPSHMNITTREYKHNPYLMWVRGGPETADHVDILGNHELIKDILFIVSGHEDLVEENIQSNIHEIVDSIDIDHED